MGRRAYTTEELHHDPNFQNELWKFEEWLKGARHYYESKAIIVGDDGE